MLQICKMSLLQSVICRTASIAKSPKWHPPNLFEKHIKSIQRAGHFSSNPGGQFWKRCQNEGLTPNSKCQTGYQTLLQRVQHISNCSGEEFLRRYQNEGPTLNSRFQRGSQTLTQNVRFASNESPKIVENFRKPIGDELKFKARPGKSVRDMIPQPKTLEDTLQENADKEEDPQDKSGRGGDDKDERDEPQDGKLDDYIFLTDIGQGKRADLSERTLISRQLLVKAAPLRVLRSRSDVPPGVQTQLPTLSERNFLKSKYLEKPRLFYTIAKLSVSDPTFTDVRFLDDCKHDFIPNIIGLINTQNTDFIDDWTTGKGRQIVYFELFAHRTFGMLKRLTAVEDVEIVSGRWTEMGPVLTVAFQVLEVFVFTGQCGDTVVRNGKHFLMSSNEWDMLRDMSVSDPKAAWRLCSWRRQLQT